MEKEIGNKGRNVFVTTFLIFLGITIIYTLVASLPIFINRIKPEHGAIFIGFLVNYGLMLIETILAFLGVFFLLKKRIKTTFLLLSLLITSFEYIISGMKFTFLFLELGFTYSLGKIGLGINFIGLIFLVWYLRLNNEGIKES